MTRPAKFSLLLVFAAAVVAAAAGLNGCDGKNAPAPAGGKKTAAIIHIKGPDYMMRLATAWSEACKRANLPFQLEVSGESTAAGIAALKKGTAQIAFCSHEVKPDERLDIMTGTGKNVQETLFGYEVLSVYTHAANPVTELSIQELTGMWTANGPITKWEQVKGGYTGDIALVGWLQAAGAAEDFRDLVCSAGGKPRECRKGISELGNSAAVVDAISKNPAAIGYSNGSSGDKPPGVNLLKISKVKDEAAIAPGADSARSRAYPLSCRLYMYTAGPPENETKEFIDWCLGPEGQALVAKEGFVPLAPFK